MISKIAGYGWWAALVVAVLLGVQTVRVADRDATIAQLERNAAQLESARSSAALAESEKTADKERTHAADTLTATETHTDTSVAVAADLRSQLDDAHRLLNDADQRAARYRAQADSDATSCSRLADRATALDRSLAEGRTVAAQLRGSLEQRDADVEFLLAVIRADRRLVSTE